MKNLFKRLSPKNFRIISAILLLLGDISLCFEMLRQMNNHQALVQMIKRVRPELFEMGTEFIDQFIQVFTKSLSISLVGFVLVNFFIYVFYISGKKFCYQYSKFMANFGLLGSLIIAYNYSKTMDPNTFRHLAEAAVYVLIIMGFKFFPYRETSKQEQ